jgi:type II secretory ATPase GspE/PulE/Tfp pilus assembly ATPase PilB-like protein
MTGLRVTPEELKSLLVDQLGVIEPSEFEKAQKMAARLRVPLERSLVEQGHIPQAFLLEHLAQHWGVGYVELRVGDVKPEALRTVGEDYARANMLIPFNRVDGTVHVAMWDPGNRKVLGELGQMTGLRVVPCLAPEGAIRRAHLLYKGDLREMLERSAAEQTLAITRGGRSADDTSVVELLNRILVYAAVARASDIHIEPYELESVVRYRIDGVMHEVLSLPPALHPPLVSRIKIQAGMRIDERRAPQDGRFESDLGGLKADMRASTIPTLWGEKVVLRVLSKETVVIDLESLGLVAADHEIVLRNILRPHGMILLTGPTGSGKTSSLYAMLSRIGNERQNIVNISTIEEPVEYVIPRVNQVQVNHQAGVLFSTGLRALLRQDPDVIMVGEIRDLETAEIAVRAALVGRLLLSTLHTNDSTGAVPRLLDMGVEPYLLASTLSLVVAQRLVRRICRNCRESAAPDSRVVHAITSRPDFERTVSVLQAQGVMGKTGDALSRVRLFRGKGCGQCSGSGYVGRIGVFELFEVAEATRDLIMQRSAASAIRAAAIDKGMKTMFQDGVAKALLGETTMEEVFRVAL